MNLKRKLKALPLGMRSLIKAVSVLSKKQKVRAYLAGGIVRDLILNKVNYDLDIVIEGDAIKFAGYFAEYLRADFRKHHRFGTATVFSLPHKVDFATARQETYSYWGALPQVKPSLIYEDLKRRDFSFNALALSLNEDNFGRVLDVVDGVHDLKKGLIRVLHEESFLEDPTRILRAIRFKERFGFSFEKKTARYLQTACEKSAFNFVNQHRLRDELILILRENEPVKCIKQVNKTVGFSFLGISKLKKADFNLLASINKSLKWFKEEFSYESSIDGWIILLMGLFYSIHVNRLRLILAGLGFSNKDKIKLMYSKKIGVIKKLSKEIRPSRVYKLLHSFSYETIIFFYAASIDRKARANIKDYLKKYSKVRLYIKGDDLKNIGILPSKQYKHILDGIFYKKIDGKISSRQEEIKEAKKYKK